MSTKNINLRLDPDTADKFKNFCQDNEITQADGFEAAIKALELTNAEESLPDERATIKSIRTNLDGVMESALTLLQHLEEANDQAHDTVQSELDSKDQTIANMLEIQKEKNRKIAELEEKNNRLTQQLHEAQTEQELAESRLQTAQTEAESKYKEQIAKLSEQVEMMDKFNVLTEKRLSEDQERKSVQDHDSIKSC